MRSARQGCSTYIAHESSRGDSSPLAVGTRTPIDWRRMQSRATPPADVFNLGVLAVAQALGLSAMSMMIFIGGIVGRELAPRPALATLPLALAIIGLAATTVPAALLARRLGRRRAFVIGALLATAAALVLVLAVSRVSFPLFCGAAVVLGMNGAFVQQYRFAAAESATPEYAGRAVAYVLVGGMMGGVLGPEVAKRSRHLLEAEYAGGFLVLAALLVLLALVVSRLRDNGARFATPPPPPHREPVSGTPREVRSAAASRLSAPGFGVAVLAAAVAYAVMSSIMTATPLHLNATGLPPRSNRHHHPEPRHRDVPAVARQRLHHGSPGRRSRAPRGRGRHDRIDRGGGVRGELPGVLGRTGPARPRVEHAVSRRHRALGAEGRRGPNAFACRPSTTSACSARRRWPPCRPEPRWPWWGGTPSTSLCCRCWPG